MEREILFRGKRIDNGEWIEGYLLKLGKYNFSDPERFGIIEEAIPVGLDGIAFNMKVDEVDPVTVGQDTGLTDKNGTKIFDGDILAGSMYPFTHDGDRNYYAVVVWFENSPAFGIETAKAPGSSVSGISAGNTDYMEGWDHQCWEVIGNIHNNPGLLSA